MTRAPVLHLVGSAVDDFHADLSRLYAGACLDALADDDAVRHRTWPTCRRTDRWRFPAGLDADVAGVGRSR